MLALFPLFIKWTKHTRLYVHPSIFFAEVASSSFLPLLISDHVSSQLSFSCRWFGMDKSPSPSYTSSIGMFNLFEDRYNNTLLTQEISPS